MSLSVQAAPGVDMVVSRLDSKKTWGERLFDAVGFDGFSKSYALVIGISDYAGGYGNLPTDDDARRMAYHLFNEVGFDYVHLLTEDQVTKDRVAELMSDEFPDLLDKNDRFFFYWSGHGDTRSFIGGEGKAGYLPLSNTPSRKWSRMIAMEDVQRWNRFLPVQQSLFLLDACFGGLAGFVPQSPTPSSLKVEQLSQPGHHLMSAGTEDEETIAGDRWSGSLFTKAVLDGLHGAADAANGFDKDNIISLTELKAYVQDRVLFERQAVGFEKEITPQVRDLRHNTGEFFFLSSSVVEVELVEPIPFQPNPPGGGGDQPGSASTPEKKEQWPDMDTAAVQRALAALGYSPGAADGILGPRTRAKLGDWQAANDFDPTGYLTFEQYRKLSRDAEQIVALASVVPQTPDVQPSQKEPLTTFRDCGDCPEMVVIPSGIFIMGSSESEPGSDNDERPSHRVNVESFAIGKYEMTFDEWDACFKAGGCDHQPGDEGWRRGKRPVINVSWEDAKQYVAWLSRETGATYRLPSEAEWEYAARAFPTSDGVDAPAYAFGSAIAKVQANFGGNVGRSMRVGQYPANAWGLHDMHGNVWEWVEDRWHNSYDGAPSDGRAWIDGNESARVLRGGSWSNGPRDLRSAIRHRYVPVYRLNNFGFRVARTLTP